jgi:hypothetical protein
MARMRHWFFQRNFGSAQIHAGAAVENISNPQVLILTYEGCISMSLEVHARPRYSYFSNHSGTLCENVILLTLGFSRSKRENASGRSRE